MSPAPAKPVLADGPTPSEAAPARPLAGLLAGRDPQRLAIRTAALVVLILALVAIDGFGTVDNIRALLASTALIGVAAAGMAFITLGGNYFMLSVGATTAVSTIVFAKALTLGLPLAIVVVLLAGAAIGLLQGLAVGVLRANPIVATIAASSIILGVGQLASGGLTVRAKGDASALNGTLFDVLPVQVLIFFVIALLLHLTMQLTRFGRETRLIGSNRDAAELAGLRTQRTIVLGYVIAAMCAALAGALLGAEAGQGNLKLGATFDFDVIAAVLVGGIAITGGRGTILDAAFGALFIGMVANVLVVAGQPYELQLAAKGVIVLLSIGLAALVAGRRK